MYWVYGGTLAKDKCIPGYVLFDSAIYINFIE